MTTEDMRAKLARLEKEYAQAKANSAQAAGDLAAAEAKGQLNAVHFYRKAKIKALAEEIKAGEAVREYRKKVDRINRILDKITCRGVQCATLYTGRIENDD